VWPRNERKFRKKVFWTEVTLESHRYIVVEGVIGVGKTHLVEALARKLSGRQVKDPVDQNPFLRQFYQDRRSFAFVTQMFFLLSRYRQQGEIAQGELFERNLVSDYLFAKDRIFAYLCLSDAELALYEQLYRLLMREPFPKPDLVVYLQASTDTLMTRVKAQGKALDKALSWASLDEFNKAFNTFFFHYDESPLLVVNTNDMNLQKNPNEVEDLIGRILDVRSGTQYYTPVKR
jgi:deoxyadenosine/deoxycytidine kinase